jgi:hypothetical protein
MSDDAERDADDAAVLARIRQALAKRRQYSAFFEWDDKATKEWGIARQFINVRPDLNVADIRPGGDPPDCEVVLLDGEIIGLEITELVDQAAVEQMERAAREDAPLEDKLNAYAEYADWPTDKLAAHLTRIVTRKDGKLKRASNGLCSRYTLLIHTDEMMLCRSDLRERLAGLSFTTSMIDDAYVMESYSADDADPYPLHRLDIEKITP